jgi:hypothetical protein
MVALLTGSSTVDPTGPDAGTRDGQRRGERRRTIRLAWIPSDDPG